MTQVMLGLVLAAFCWRNCDFMVRFCPAAPKKPLQGWFSQLCKRGEVKDDALLVFCLFLNCSLVLFKEEMQGPGRSQA